MIVIEFLLGLGLLAVIVLVSIAAYKTGRKVQKEKDQK